MKKRLFGKKNKIPEGEVTVRPSGSFVVDLGRNYTKIGFLGDNEPRKIFPSVTTLEYVGHFGCTIDPGNSEVGWNAVHQKGWRNVERPVGTENYSGSSGLCLYAIETCVKDREDIRPEQASITIGSITAIAPSDVDFSLLERAREGLPVNNFTIENASVCAAYEATHVCKTKTDTVYVVDIGYHFIYFNVVHQGTPQPVHFISNPLIGFMEKLFTEEEQRKLDIKDYAVDTSNMMEILLHHCTVADSLQHAFERHGYVHYESEVALIAKYEDSFLHELPDALLHEVMNYVKFSATKKPSAKLGYYLFGPDKEKVGIVPLIAHQKKPPLQLGVSVHLAMEALFNPLVLAEVDTLQNQLVKLIEGFAKKTDTNHVIALNGGATSCAGFSSRLQKELENLMPGHHFELISDKTGNLAWHGAARKAAIK